MPIALEKLNEARQPLDDRILAFLQSNASQAYALHELYAAIEGYDPQIAALMMAFAGRTRSAALLPYEEALSRLARDQKIFSAKVQGLDYFGIARK